jgi:hypothetical protein
VSGDCLDVVGARSSVREPRGCQLAQSMCAADRQAGALALPLEPTGQIRGSVWRATVHQERHVAARDRIQGKPEIGMQRYQQNGVGLLLAHRDTIALDVLPTHAGHVADALCRIE